MITWDVISAIKTALEDITVANGYQTNAGAAVSLERLDVQDDATSMLVTMEDLVANSDLTLSQRQRSMTVRIEAAAPANDTTAMETAHKLLDDMERALVDKKTCLAPAGVSAVRLGNATITPRSDGSEAVVASWSCEITYRRNTN